MKLLIIYIFALTNFAGMVKLVDMPDLGSGAARRVGSSPITRTESSNESLGFFIFIGFLSRKIVIIAENLIFILKLSYLSLKIYY